MSSLSPPTAEPPTKLRITRIKPRRNRRCDLPSCNEMATHRVEYDHGHGFEVENCFNFCEPHHAEEVVNVAVDNRNVQAGFILF